MLKHELMEKRSWSTGSVSSLKEEACAEQPVSHGEGDQHAQYPGRSPTGLRQTANISDGVEEPRAGKDAEVKQSR